MVVGEAVVVAGAAVVAVATTVVVGACVGVVGGAAEVGALVVVTGAAGQTWCQSGIWWHLYQRLLPKVVDVGAMLLVAAAAVRGSAAVTLMGTCVAVPKARGTLTDKGRVAETQRAGADFQSRLHAAYRNGHGTCTACSTPER